MTSEGQGIGKSDGFAIFVKGAVVGDTVLAELTKVKKRYAFARMIEILESSPDRIKNSCDCFNRCGGCPYGELSYEAQLRLKEKQVRDKLIHIGGLESPQVRPILGMENPFHYRNKAVMSIWAGGLITKKGGIAENLDNPSVGFYRGKSHQVVDCKDCLLQSEPAMAAAETLRSFLISDNITVYDPKWGKGLFRHLAVRTAANTGEVMVVLVINGKGIPNGEKLVQMLDDAIYALPAEKSGIEYSLESVVINVNKEKDGRVFGDEWITLAGKPTILDTAGGLKFEISPASFYQVNPAQMEVLYEKAMTYAGLSGKETVLDLYCGVGTIGLFAAAAGAGRVIGIESVKSAVIDANRNAVINGMVNPRYVCGKAEEELPKLLSGEGLTDETLRIDRADVVFLDPPRAGCEKSLLEAVVKAEPERIVYVSCDPATLARDVKLLTEGGYRFVEATPVDMFPWTGHVETVVLLSKLNTKQHIEVELNLDELDLTAAESKATYDEVKAYVLEKHGLKVSSLYISQVKRKCGLDVGQNYNLSKKEDAKVPQCPPEKEAAIMDALKHFQMI